MSIKPCIKIVKFIPLGHWVYALGCNQYVYVHIVKIYYIFRESFSLLYYIFELKKPPPKFMVGDVNKDFYQDYEVHGPWPLDMGNKVIL